MNPDLPPLDSTEDLRVRALRDSLYGPSTAVNWIACREHWLLAEAARWLEAEAAKDQAAARAVALAAALSQVAAQPAPR